MIYIIQSRKYDIYTNIFKTQCRSPLLGLRNTKIVSYPNAFVFFPQNINITFVLVSSCFKARSSTHVPLNIFMFKKKGKERYSKHQSYCIKKGGCRHYHRKAFKENTNPSA